MAKISGRKYSIAGVDGGYTLVELLVVLAILGFLAVIATPAYFKYLESAKVSTATTEIANLSASLDLFKFDVGRYPTTAEGLEALKAMPADASRWNGPYVAGRTSLNDPWRHPYRYVSPGEHGDFDLFSYGASASPGDGAVPLVSNW